MDFCWVDQFNVMVAPNRRMRRIMEEENNKLRKKARREYNETVRELALFVKGRDKRVIDMQRKRYEERERKKKEEGERKKELERQKAERARKYEEPEWAKVDDVEGEEIEEIVEDDNKKKGDGKELYCVACGKKFKSDKQWKNHEQSKKHKEKVEELREAFIDEDEEYEVGEADEVREVEDEDEIDAKESGILSADDDVDELLDQFDSTVEIQEKDDEVQSSEHDDFVDMDSGSSLKGLHSEMGSDNDETSILEAMVSGRKNRKNSGLTQKPNRASEKIQVEVDSDEMDFMEYNNLKGPRRSRGGRKQRGRNQDEATHTKVAESNGQPENSVHDDKEASSDSLLETESRRNRRGRKQKGRTRKEATHTEVAESNGQPENNGHDDTTKDASSDSLLETESRGKEDDKLGTSCGLPKPAADKKGTAKQGSNFKSKEATKGRKKKV